MKSGRSYERIMITDGEKFRDAPWVGKVAGTTSKCIELERIVGKNYYNCW